MSSQPPTQPTPQPIDPEKIAAAITNGWKEAYRHMELLRTDVPGAAFRTAEIMDDGDNVHHIVILSEAGWDAVIVRTELEDEFRTRFLHIPGTVVEALQLRR